MPMIGVALEATTATEARDAIVREIETRITMADRARDAAYGTRPKAEHTGGIKELTGLRDFLRSVSVISREDSLIAAENQRMLSVLSAIAKADANSTAEDLREIARASLPNKPHYPFVAKFARSRDT